MGVNYSAIAELARLLPPRDIKRLTQAAEHANTLEYAWAGNLAKMIDDAIFAIVDSYSHHGVPPADLPMIERFFVEHYFAVCSEAFAFELPQAADEDVVAVKLAKYPVGKPPKSTKALLEQWNLYRKKGKAPPRQKAEAARIKAAFLKKAQELYVKHSEDFRRGKTYDQRNVVQAMQRAFGATQAQAQTIVATETTRYYNAVRRAVYDESDDVTHWLFVCIRDYRTTVWCLDRSGLVYKKGDPLLDRETPPIHWKCRSEMLPLTMQNAQHRALIKDKSRWRRRHECAPLPPGWNVA